MLPILILLYIQATLCKDTVLITGASSGIGAVTAKHLALAGHNVVACARRADRLASLIEDIKGNGGDALAVSCDVSDATTLEKAFAEAEKVFGSVDHVFVNAGYEGDGKPATGFTQDMQKVFDINVIGTTHTYLEALKAFSKNPDRDHSIIITSSIAGQMKRLHGEIISDFGAFPNFYAMSKAALDNFVRITAGQQLTKAKKENRVPVRVLGVAPAVFASEMVDKVAAHEVFAGTPVTSVESFSALNPLFQGKVGNPIEIARFVQAIFENTSGWKTGDLVVIDNDATYLTQQHYNSIALSDTGFWTVDKAQVFDVTGTRPYQFEKTDL